MTQEPHELILDHLRALRSDVTELRRENMEIRETLFLIRTQVEIDRIKSRLELTDA